MAPGDELDEHVLVARPRSSLHKCLDSVGVSGSGSAHVGNSRERVSSVHPTAKQGVFGDRNAAGSVVAKLQPCERIADPSGK